MATRRHRIVIKPNIRPTAAKTGGSIPSKPKTPSSNASCDSPSPAIRPQHVPHSQEEIHQQCTDEEEGNREILSDADNFKHASKADVDLPEQDATGDKTLGGTDSDLKELPGSKETKSGSHCQREVAHTKKEQTFTSTQDVCIDDVSGQVTSNLNATPLTSTVASPRHHRKNPKLSTSDVENQALKQKDITNSAEVVKVADVDGDAATPSEADSSSFSEALSLDPDNERREEVTDKAQKKRRWHKSKKLRVEPLPSREKSPDRQKMKMGDLLCWNPQQNFLPKKNKKKTPFKNENRSLSPTPSLAADDDKESTNQSASLPAPQVMIGPDGSIVLNTESLLINVQKEDTKPKEVLEDDDDDRYLNTNTYRKYKKTKLWTERETEKFFMGLSMCGTDFSLLTNLLPHRSRRELKNKFYREERRNRDLIDKSLANRQQYDLAPFERMAADDDKKMKKEMKKRMKKESLNEKKAEKARKKGKKRKNKESEDEEDDWGPEYDEEDEENQNAEVGSKEATDTPVVVKNKSKVPKVKSELDYQNKLKPVGKGVPCIVPEDTSRPFVPGYPTTQEPVVQESLAEQAITMCEEYTDLDNPRMKGRPSKTYSRLNSQNRARQQQTTLTAGTGTNFNTSGNVIHAIPGSSQVQIEMEGVQNPVQGVLIPSHMVPQIAPQLGIHGNAAGMQVLLVQEETESGSLVHVYVIPEGDTARSSRDNVGGGPSGPGSYPAFSSPIPSPHPTTSIQSPHAVAPFPAPYNPHPLASVCSPHPNSTFHSPPPVPDAQSGGPVQRLYPQTYTSPPQENLDRQSSSARPSSETSFTNQEQHNMRVSLSLAPSPTAHSANSGLRSTHYVPASSDMDKSNNPHLTEISTSTTYHPPPPAVVDPIPLSHKTDAEVSLQTSALFSSSTDTPVISVSQSYSSNLLSSSMETTAISVSQSDSSNVIVAAVDVITVKADDSQENSIPYNSSVGVTETSDFDDDCIIVNPDRAQSQLDKSAMPGI